MSVNDSLHRERPIETQKQPRSSHRGGEWSGAFSQDSGIILRNPENL